MKFRVNIEKGKDVEGRFIIEAIKASNYPTTILVEENESLAVVELEANSITEVVEMLSVQPTELLTRWSGIQTILEEF